MLAGKLDVDQRVELPDKVFRATPNSIGQYVLVVIGESRPTDYSPLHAYIADARANPPPAPSAGATTSP